LTGFCGTCNRFASYSCIPFVKHNLRFLSECFAIRDGKPYVRSIPINAWKSFCACVKQLFELSETQLPSQKPKRVASMLVAKFSASPEKPIHLKMSDNYKMQKLKKVTNFSFFANEKSLCAFHFLFLSLPVTSG